MGANPIWLVSLQKEEIRPQAYVRGWWCKDAGRTWPSVSQGKRLQKRPNLQTPWFQDSSTSHCKTSFCCLSRSVGGTSLGWFQRTNTGAKRRSMPAIGHRCFDNNKLSLYSWHKILNLYICHFRICLV